MKKKDLTWDNAQDWENASNSDKEIHDEPKWKWDCGFKLDFDGSLLTVSSRFYPPHENNGDWWEGTVNVLFLGEDIFSQEFRYESLEELKEEVEKFTKNYAVEIKSTLKPNQTPIIPNPNSPTITITNSKHIPRAILKP